MIKSKTKLIVLALIVVILICGGIFLYYYHGINVVTEQTQNTDPLNDADTLEENQELAAPTKDFVERITKKPFGIFVTPQNSPVGNEKFYGYHTGADAEYEEVQQEVPVYAIADGDVISKRTAQGYGGVTIIRHNINGKIINTVYGHLDINSVTNKTAVKKGEQIAVLGEGYSAQTDGERKHLHLGMPKNDRVDLIGYVQSKDQLENWYNPLDFYK